MQVNAVKTEGLVHEYQVTVAAADLQRQVDNRLKQLGATTKMDGFRPGKAPIEVIKKRFGASVLSEVVENTVNNAAMKAVNEKSLRPAVEPKIEFASPPQDLAALKDLVFTMQVELVPEIGESDFSAIALENPVVEVAAADIDDALARIAKGNRAQEKAESDYAAKMGDVAMIDFDGSVDGERRDGMKGEDFPLELGSNRFIPGFEEQLVGVKEGNARDVKVGFPKDYYVPDLAGKDAVFKVAVKGISRLKEPEVNDDLAKAAGFDTLDALKKDVKEQIAKNYKDVSRAVLKRRLMDVLAARHAFPLPPTLVAREFDSLWQQVTQAKASNQLDADDKNKTDAELEEEYRKIADRRVRLGLLLSEVARRNKIELGREDVRQAIFREAMRYKGQEKQVVEYFSKNASAREQLVAPLLEEKVVDYIFGKAKLTDKKISRDELSKLAEA